MPSDETLLLQAVRLARASRDRGNHPFGALLASAEGEVLLEAENTVVSGSDPTGHAETNLVRLAGHHLDRATLATTTLYSSAEPCAMCAGAIYWSGIGGVVFALAEAELLALTGSDPHNPTLDLPCRDVFAAGQRPIEVRGPFALPEARDVHHGFWHPPTAASG
jgi:tRNA(Arg) A34 adenosine deaminase TadA